MTHEERTARLRERVLATIDEAGTLDPHEVTGKVIADLDDRDLEDALRATLPGFVRDVLRGMRATALAEPPKSVDGQEQKQRTTSGKASRRATRSLAGEFPIHCKRGYIKLSEATFDDLIEAAGELETQAVGLTVNAAKYRALAQKVKRTRGATVVGDLSDAAVRKVFTA